MKVLKYLNLVRLVVEQKRSIEYLETQLKIALNKNVSHLVRVSELEKNNVVLRKCVEDWKEKDRARNEVSDRS